MLASLKAISHSAVQVESASYDYMCPLMANVCTSISNRHRISTGAIQTLNLAGMRYLADEDFTNYSKNIYFESLYYDESLAEDKDRLKRSGEQEFISWVQKKENLHPLPKSNDKMSNFARRKSEDDFDLDFIDDCKIKLFAIKIEN